MLRVIGIAILFTFAVLIKYGCGEPETEKYNPPQGASTGTASAGTSPTDCQSVFDAQISPALTTCGGCHGSAPQPDAPPFATGNNTTARTALKSAFAAVTDPGPITNADSYTAFMTTAGKHTGGNQVAILPASNVATWLSCEAG